MIGYLDQDGTAIVTGCRLPADQAAAACARIEDLAKAAKRAGHPGRIGPLRADIYVGLLEGRWQQLTREEIIADLLAQATPEDTTPGGDSAAEAPAAEAPADGDAGPAADAPAAADDGDGVGSPIVPVRVGVEVRVGLSTLLGRDRHPGEIPGWGPVIAETARTIVAAPRTGEWRYAITDPEGQLIMARITRRRPAISEGTGLPAALGRGGIVELHIPAALLTELAAHPDACGEWAAVIADLAAQYAADRTQGARGQDPAARFAGAVLRRHVQIRDRVCVHPGCRCSARHADLDHTVDHTYGGGTTEANSGPLCRHDHRLKGEGGWRLHQPESGYFVWGKHLGVLSGVAPRIVLPTYELPIDSTRGRSTGCPLWLVIIYPPSSTSMITSLACAASRSRRSAVSVGTPSERIEGRRQTTARTCRSRSPSSRLSQPAPAPPPRSWWPKVGCTPCSPIRPAVHGHDHRTARDPRPRCSA